jgi:hypothetical protein
VVFSCYIFNFDAWYPHIQTLQKSKSQSPNPFFGIIACLAVIEVTDELGFELAML